MILALAYFASAVALAPEAEQDVRCAASIVATGRRAALHDTATDMAGRAAMLQFYLGRLSVRSDSHDWTTAINDRAAHFGDRKALAATVLNCSLTAMRMQMPSAR